MPAAPPERLRQDQAKARVAEEIAKGASVADAMAAAGRGVKTYENWRANDLEFRARIDAVRADRNLMIKGKGSSVENRQLSFAEWRQKFLGRETYPHQQMWIDILEGREPANLHPSMVYEPARPNRILLNTPPFHSKSTVITQEYVVYRICMRPSTRVCVISKTREKAQKFLYSAKRMLTGRQYAAMQAAYAPPEGWRHPDYPWTATKIYVDNPEGAEKDPTVEVLGIRGDIYGGRLSI